MSNRMNLDALARKYGTDKSSDGHDYCRIYETLFAPIRFKPLLLLELGVGGHENPEQGGASLRMWRAYFPNATIIGVDSEPKTFAIDGVTIYQAHQEDPDELARIHRDHGDFDIIIDDASHLSSLTIRSFEIGFPRLRPGGWYLVEDLHSSYAAWYYGADEANPDPDEPAKKGPTAMQWLKRLADDCQHLPDGRGVGDYWRGYDIASICFHPDLCVVRKK